MAFTTISDTFGPGSAPLQAVCGRPEPVLGRAKPDPWASHDTSLGVRSI
jgi:hypothetical protein